MNREGEKMSLRFVCLSSTGALLLLASSVMAAEKPHPPYPHYWMNIATSNQSIPGMSEQMAGMAARFGGRGASFGPRRELLLQLEAPRVVQEPKADHLIPPGQKMGERLPLVTPVQEKTDYRPERGEREKPEQIEKPKVRMLIYWGCGDTVPKGQPRVVDTATMSPAEFGRALAGRSASPQTPPLPSKGWTYADWPNADDRQDIPKDASLLGSHQVKGNYLPDISFALDQKRDFMVPVEFSTMNRTAAGAWQFQWKAIPTASAYFATAMGHNQKTGETIVWSASDVPETGFGLMGYLTNGDVQRFLKDRVIMPASRTNCTIPAGVFGEVEGGMLQFIAYGEELNIVHPPRPKDPKQPWNPQWSVKVRLKSTASSPLMAADGGQEDARRRPAKRSDGDDERQEPSSRPEKPAGGVLDGFKGLLGF